MDKPEHALAVNNRFDTWFCLSNITLYLSDWKMVYEIKSRFILLLHKVDTWGSY